VVLREERLRRISWLAYGLGVASLGVTASTARAQTTAPAADNPSIRVGVTLFADYTYTASPEVRDSDGNEIHPSAFNASRTYLNITGNLSRRIAFRITPDIVRETGTSSLNGSLTFRLKYGYAQVNLDDWVAPGAWTRLGLQGTPWVNFEEGIYRYRFQGTVFPDREGYMSSSDAGASFRYNAPSNYGEVHVGIFNGENYNRAEANDQKSLQLRGSVRPFAKHGGPLLQGLRTHVFYNGDHYVRAAERRRFLASATFEHKFINAGFDYLRTADQISVRTAAIDGRGYSFWLTPRSPSGWELLFRRDHMMPDDVRDNETRDRTIVGVAYWFPHQGGVSSALLLDYDGQTFHNFAPALPKQQRIALHALVNF
jgi:hypothetical protein